DGARVRVELVELSADVGPAERVEAAADRHHVGDVREDALRAVHRDGIAGVGAEAALVDAEHRGAECVAGPDLVGGDRDAIRDAAGRDRRAAGDGVGDRVHLDDGAGRVGAAEVPGARRVETAVGGGADEARVLALLAVGAAEVDEGDGSRAGDERGEEAGAGVDGKAVGVALVRERDVDAPGRLLEALRPRLAGLRRIVRLQLAAVGQGDAGDGRRGLVLPAAGGDEREQRELFHRALLVRDQSRARAITAIESPGRGYWKRS